MNKLEAETERIRFDSKRAETLGLSLDDVLPPEHHQSQRSAGSSWKESRSLYQPKTSQLQGLEHRSRRKGAERSRRKGSERSRRKGAKMSPTIALESKERDSSKTRHDDDNKNRPPSAGSSLPLPTVSHQSSSSRSSIRSREVEVSFSQHQPNRTLASERPHQSSRSLTELPHKSSGKKHRSHRHHHGHSSSRTLTDLPAPSESKHRSHHHRHGHSSRSSSRRSLENLPRSSSEREHRSHRHEQGHSSHSSSHSLKELPVSSESKHASYSQHDDLSFSSMPLTVPSESRRSHHRKKKSKKKKKHKSKERSSSRSSSTCSSCVSRPDSHSSRQRTSTSTPTDERRISFFPKRHVRTFTVPSDGDSYTVDTDATPRTKPGKGSNSDSERSYSQRCLPSSRYDSDASTISTLDTADYGSRKKKHTSSASANNHPPTDLEFALGMDSAARRLERIAKDQQESMVRKQVDYDQLRGLLDVYAKDPMNTDPNQLNQLLDAMDDVITDTEDTSCSIVRPLPSTDNSPPNRSRRQVNQESTRVRDGGRPPSVRHHSSHGSRSDSFDRIQPRHRDATPLAAVENEMHSTRDLGNGSSSDERMDKHKQEILRACGDDEHDFVTMSRQGAMPRRNSLGSAETGMRGSSSPPPKSHSRSSSTRTHRLKSQDRSTSRRSRRSNREREDALAKAIEILRSSSSGASRASVLSQRDKEIYKALDLQEDSSILSDAKSSASGLGTLKKEVLEVFGNDVGTTEDYVAVPLKPARSSRRSIGDDVKVEETPSNCSPTSRSPTEQEDEGKNHGYPRQPRMIPRMIPRMMKKMRSRRKLRNGDS